jgi:probable HAF family extracellular repeat protein
VSRTKTAVALAHSSHHDRRRRLESPLGPIENLEERRLLSSINTEFTKIDFPGTTETAPTGINNSGQIVGLSLTYPPDFSSFSSQGFLLSGDTYTSIEFPAGSSPDPINTPVESGNTGASGISNSGQIVGSYKRFQLVTDPQSPDYPQQDYFHDSFLLSDGGYTTIADPKSVLQGLGDQTDSHGINNSGSIVGDYYDSSTNHGFLLSGGTYTTIDFPGSVAGSANGINDSGQIVGDYAVDTGGSVRPEHGYLLSGGKFTTIDVPGAVGLTAAQGINSPGQIVGYYSDSSGSSHGFLLSGGKYTTIDFPNGTNTQADAINDSGQIVGTYDSPDGTYHGFLMSPVTTPKTPTITWADPARIVYGMALGSTQLDAIANVPGTSANVPGSFTYSPSPGAVLHAGSKETLSVTFTPDDAIDYTTATATVTMDVARATPTIIWPNPATIDYGAALSTTQLDATASYSVGGASLSVPGTFTYSSPVGTVLKVGSGQILSVTFVPTDMTDYASTTAKATLEVQPATPTPLVTVSGVQVETVHLAKRKTASEIVARFSGAVNGGEAGNLGNYQLATVPKGKKKAHGKRIRLSSAVYNPATHTVTLGLTSKLAFNPPTELQISAAGILDTSGRALDGNGDGQPGGDYIALLTKGGARPQFLRGAATFIRRPPPRFLTRP